MTTNASGSASSIASGEGIEPGPDPRGAVRAGREGGPAAASKDRGPPAAATDRPTLDSPPKSPTIDGTCGLLASSSRPTRPSAFSRFRCPRRASGGEQPPCRRRSPARNAAQRPRGPGGSDPPLASCHVAVSVHLPRIRSDADRAPTPGAMGVACAPASRPRATPAPPASARPDRAGSPSAGVPATRGSTAPGSRE